MSGVEVFDFEGHDLRAVRDENKDVWWIAADVAKILEYASTKDATRLLDEDMKGRQIVPTLGGNQQMVVISQGGLWRLIMRSQRDEAKRLERKVVDVILPTIHRTGSYTAPGLIPAQREPGSALELPKTHVAALRAYAAELEAHEVTKEAHEATRAEKEAAVAQVAELTPAAEAWNRIVTAKGAHSVSDAAKMLHNIGMPIGEGRLFTFMAAKGWIFRGAPSSSNKKGAWRAYQEQVNNLRLVEIPGTRPERDAGGNVVGQIVRPPTVRITGKGLDRLLFLLGQEQLAKAQAKAIGR